MNTRNTPRNTPRNTRNTPRNTRNTSCLTLAGTLGELKLGEPLFVRNLTVYPLTNGGGSETKVATLAEGIQARTVRVSELEVPTVEEIILDNQGSEPLFLLDGEEIFGAHQTRVTTTAALIDAETSVSLPVACIEEGRWEGDSRFQGSFSSTHPRLRSIICRGVNDSLKSARTFRAPQRLVWDEVTRKLTSLKVTSATSSFHDLAATLADETARYAVDASELSNAQGMIVAAGKEILGFEYAADPGLFKRLAPRVLRGYALDALERRSVADPPSQKELDGFLGRIRGLEPCAYPGVSLGQDWRFGDRKLVGRALVKSDRILQASFFPAVN
jgi:hypothetical protein